jgi:hypothetical protein
MGQVGSTGIYYTPPVPGGLLGESAALAYARGARTPSDIASQGFQLFLTQLVIVAVILGIIVLVTTYYKPKSTFIPGPPEKERYTAV